MIKSSFEIGDFWEKHKMPILGTSIALGSTYLINEMSRKGKEILNKSIEDVIESNKFPKKNLEDIIIRSKQIAGISDVPHAEIKGYENAAYVPPGSISQEEERDFKEYSRTLKKSKSEKKKSKAMLLDKIVDFSKKPTGGIILGDKFNNPAIVAHEIGHVMIEREGGINKFIQNYSPGLTNIGAIGALTGLATKFFIDKDIGNIMFLSGMGATGIGGLGTIYKEYLASNKAKEILDKQELLKDDTQKILNRAIGTYIISEGNKIANQFGYGVLPGMILNK